MKRIILLLISICFCTQFYAQAVSPSKRLVNDHWTFQRLSKQVEKGEIKNQGTGWFAQYNVEHVSGASNELEIPQDSLKAEFALLEQNEWTSVSLPHTPFIEDLTVLHQWQGVCYYKKLLSVTPQEASGILWLEFEGAMQLADIWVNGEHLLQHAGGYTPFVVNLTGRLSADKENEILVRLDNRDNPLIPPGKPLNTLDFCYYGGIYRNVNLIAKPAVYITHPILANRTAGGGLFVTYPNVSSQEAEVKVQVEVANSLASIQEVEVRHTLYNWSKQKGKGNEVCTIKQTATLHAGTESTLNGTMLVKNPRLWHPDEPNLYLLQTDVYANGKQMDSETTRIGIRHLEITREKGFVINGKPLRLVGSNRHMEYPYVGNAISDNAQYRDIYQIRNNGFNTVRLGHYLQAPSVLDACDELGLLAIEPIPGWQFFNNNKIFKEMTYSNVRDLIRRDRNHPSIVIWETTLNESWPPYEWRDEAIRVAHEEFPGDQCFTGGDMYGYHGFDIGYNDWDDKSFTRPCDGTKPGFIREYYDFEFGGHFSTTRISRGDGRKALLQNVWNAQWEHNLNRTLYPWTIGDAIWSMYDYNRGCADNICYSGAVDLFRLPKFSLHFFRSQVAAGSPIPEGEMPYELFVTDFRNEEMTDTVQVFGNVDEVELQLNGRVLERRSPDNGPDTKYVPRADGGNCKNLAFPPFTFSNVPMEKGELKAVGYQKGKKVAEYSVRSYGTPNKLHIEYFESGMPATTDDLLIVYVRLLDKKGTLCLLNGVEVKLEVEGGKVVGPNSFQTESGIASFLVSTGKDKKLSIHATAKDGMKADTTIKLKR